MSKKSRQNKKARRQMKKNLKATMETHQNIENNKKKETQDS